jgi:hypothetical protein
MSFVAMRCLGEDILAHTVYTLDLQQAVSFPRTLISTSR